MSFGDYAEANDMQSATTKRRVRERKHFSRSERRIGRHWRTTEAQSAVLIPLSKNPTGFFDKITARRNALPAGSLIKRKTPAAKALQRALFSCGETGGAVCAAGKAFLRFPIRRNPSGVPWASRRGRSCRPRAQRPARDRCCPDAAAARPARGRGCTAPS